MPMNNYHHDAAIVFLLSFLAYSSAQHQDGFHRTKAGKIERMQKMVNDIVEEQGEAIGLSNKAQKLRQDLLKNYDVFSYPWEHEWQKSRTNSSSTVRKGLNVGININFHKVLSVDVKNSKIDLLVWYRLKWVDPRLQWDPNDYGGLDRIWFLAGDPEWDEIWNPEIMLWNQDESLDQSLARAAPTVTPDGEVFWSRPGHLRPSCRFEGLVNFPFDKVQCAVEFGTWSHSGLYIRPVAFDGGYTVGGSLTSGESYNEFFIENVEVEEFVYPPFPIAPEEDFPVVIYTIIFGRAWQPYVRGFIFLQIVLNLIGFICFWLPPNCGERTGLAITALLASVASEIVIESQLPFSTTITWMTKFSFGSLVFASLPLFESAFVIYMHHCTRDNFFIPLFMDLLRIRFEKFVGSHPVVISEEIRAKRRKENNKYWRLVGTITDEVSQILFPISYGIYIAISFAQVDMS